MSNCEEMSRATLSRQATKEAIPPWIFHVHTAPVGLMPPTNSKAERPSGCLYRGDV
jgi:hypothetical protein